MSISSAIEVECPKCHTKQEVMVWSSINVQINPEAKEQLLEGQLNRLHCRACGAKATLVTSLLYHDMGQHYWAQYWPFDEALGADLRENFTPDGELKMGVLKEREGYLSRPPHLVFDMDELVRYIIFRDRLAAAASTLPAATA